MGKKYIYKLVYSSFFIKDFKKIPSYIQEKAILVCKNLLKNPYENVRKLKNIQFGKFRTRIGNYRLRFDISETDIILHSIKHRKDVYK